MNKLFQIFLFLLLINILTFSLSSCDFKKSDKAGGSYVKPSVNYKGQTRKGHVRKKVSTDKNGVLNQNRSRDYYQTSVKNRQERC
jgi:hypothetical protein